MAQDHCIPGQGNPDAGRGAFLAMITHDDRNSFYHIARSDPRLPEGSPLKWAGFSRGTKHLSEFEFEEGYDWFVTRNGFSSKLSRTSDMCRQLNSFLFDIDAHGGENPAAAADLALAALESAWNSGCIPIPTMAIRTGRGAHVYYALERSTATRKSDGSPNDRGVKFFRDVEARLCAAVKKALEPIPGIVVDESVFDAARVARVPGTLNSKAQETCRVVFESGQYHSLPRLSEALPRLPTPCRRDGRGKGSYRRRDRYGQLATCRMRGIEKLQRARGFGNVGNRENMCFCYYNSAVQVYESRDDAFGALSDFNARFADPLPQRELDGIRSSVDKVGFYRMGAPKLSAFLNLTEEEAVSTGFFMTKRDIDREESKARTANTRKKRNAKIAFLSNIPDVTKAQIAAAAGCSTRTVYAVLADRDANRAISLDDATRLALDFAKGEKGVTTKETVAEKLQADGCGDGRSARKATPPGALRPAWSRAGP